jgi:glycopeptide antibiotics resistance protein
LTQSRGSTLGSVAKASAVAYLVAVLAVTLLPIFGSNRFDPITVHMTPFRTIGNAVAEGPVSSEFALAVANVAMFVPLGAFVSLLRPHSSSWYALAVGFAFSCAIEVSQLAISLILGHGYRTADVDDVILNVAGALLGYLVFRSWRRRASAR